MTPPPLDKTPQENEKELIPVYRMSFRVKGDTTIKLLQRIEDEGLEKVWFDER